MSGPGSIPRYVLEAPIVYKTLGTTGVAGSTSPKSSSSDIQAGILLTESSPGGHSGQEGSTAEQITSSPTPSSSYSIC